MIKNVVLSEFVLERASSYELGYRNEFCGVFIWEISAQSTGMNSRNTTKMKGGGLVLFATVIALSWDSCNFTKTPKVEFEIHTRPKLSHFGSYVVRAKLFDLKSFVPVTGLECS